MASWQIENGQKQLAQLRQINGVNHPLSTDKKQRPKSFVWADDVDNSIPKSDKPSFTLAPVSNDYKPVETPKTTPKPKKPTKKLKVPLQRKGETVRILPGLAVEFLNREHRLQGKPIDSIARVWLVLRAMGNDRGGLVPYAKAKDWLTWRGSPWRLFGKRQFKMLLARGEGVFWTRNKTKSGELQIFLKSAANVAKWLGITTLRGKPVDVVVSRISGKIADFRAVLYAAWVAGRGEDSKPITRKVKEKITNCSKYRQRSYEGRAGVKVTRNYSLLCKYSDYRLQRARIHEHRAAFRFTDWRGFYGEPGAAYVATHLPNSDQAPRWCNVIENKRTRAINKQLKDPCNMVGEGNIGEDIDIVRVFFDDAAAASKAVKRGNETFWTVKPSKPIKKKDPAKVWHIMG